MYGNDPPGKGELIETIVARSGAYVEALASAPPPPPKPSNAAERAAAREAKEEAAASAPAEADKAAAEADKAPVTPKKEANEPADVEASPLAKARARPPHMKACTL